MSNPIDIAVRMRDRRVTNWIHFSGAIPRSNGYIADAECVEAADEIDWLRLQIEHHILYRQQLIKAHSQAVSELRSCQFLLGAGSDSPHEDFVRALQFTGGSIA